MGRTVGRLRLYEQGGAVSEDIEKLQLELREFAKERDWEQFHSPRNLATALSIEASELLEHFQWMRPQDGPGVPDGKLGPVSEELADVFIYALRLADVIGVDLIKASKAKLAANAAKYPVALVRGSSRKYTEY